MPIARLFFPAFTARHLPLRITGNPMTSPSRNTVGVYDRPHPLRSRKVLLPVIVAAGVAIVYGLWAYFV